MPAMIEMMVMMACRSGISLGFNHRVNPNVEYNQLDTLLKSTGASLYAYVCICIHQCILLCLSVDLFIYR